MGKARKDDSSATPPSPGPRPVRRPLAGLMLKGLWRLAVTFSILGSTVLWIGSAVMEVRSFWVVDWVSWRPKLDPADGARDIVGWSARGGVGIFITDYPNPSWNQSPSFHYANDRMMEYPYVPEPERTKGWSMRWGGFTLYKNDRWVEIRMQDGGAITRMRYKQKDYAMIVPWWAVMVLSTPIPLVAGIVFGKRRRLARRRKQGLCEKCGYDLRATPKRCPECGWEPKATG